MDMAIAQADLLDRVDLQAVDVGRRLSTKRRAEMGQFFTPAAIAGFMAELLEPRAPEMRLIDPGAGIGVLSAAWVARACELEQPPKSIKLLAYEADAELATYLRRTMALCAEACETRGIEFRSEVVEADFIAEGVEMLSNRALFGDRRPCFDSAILNPPYRKLNSQSKTRAQLRTIGIETSNLYAAFLWLVFRLLDDNGQMVAITPRSFCNGSYFRPFREAFLREMKFTRLHVFESRKAAFQDADVLQENVIFRAVKCDQSPPATISSSDGPNDPDICLRQVEPGELVSARDSVIHICANEIGTRFAEQINSFVTTLDDLSIQVSTGRVVDFRAKQALTHEANGHTVPLIYPLHFTDGYIAWPKPGRKPNYLTVAADTRSLLVPSGVYVLVKRFSAKEERRRVTAAVCDPGRLPGESYGFENHVNYFHCNGRGLPQRLARGLAAYLNSTLVDTYFRQFSGHTQVNADDLRSLRYPDAATLDRIGSRIGESFPNQDEIDSLISKELSMAGDDPVKVGKRLKEAQQVLAALGLPEAQQNERSALTLLALLDLPPNRNWKAAKAPLRGITPIMDWFAEHYGRRYAPNTRETVRRQTIHHFIEAGIVIQNPDDPSRAINSGLNVYQIETGALELLRTYRTKQWDKHLRTWLKSAPTLKARYARERSMTRIPLTLATGARIDLSPGGQNVLVKQIIDEFCPRFTPGGKPIYVGDTDTKWAHFDDQALAALGVKVDAHGKMPDVAVHYTERDWLVLIEAVTSHGPVDGKRQDELKRLFRGSRAGLVFVTAFLDRAAMVKYLGDIAWETEVWVADAPSHLIHFNGERFLGPYEE
jgi:adenine-specific DNA-methyltransferase